MKKVFNFIKNFIKRHKFLSLIIIVALIASGYFIYQKFHSSETEVSYITTQVESGLLISSISGTGQVSALNQVDVKAKSSGDIVSLLATMGQEVTKGEALAYLNATDALKTVRDAATSLETAQLELAEVLEPADELTLLQAETALISAQDSQQKAIDDLAQSYEDGFNDVSNAFLDLPNIMTELNDILFGYDFSNIQNNIDFYSSAIRTSNQAASQLYYDDAYHKYQTARTAYDHNFTDYKNTSRFSDTTTIAALIAETYETAKNVAEAIKSTNNLIRLYQDELVNRNLTPSSLSSTHLTSLSSFTSKINSYLSSLLSATSAIQNNQESIVSAERSIKEKELSLAKVQAGSDELSVRAKKIAVQQKQDALIAAQQSLADCSVWAPFAGVIAAVNVAQGEDVSSGTTIVTLITQQKIAEITLNEIDVAQVAVGQKANLSFDAVSDLSITGEVAEVDSLGTVNQGVVSYGVKIVFDVQDERIKPGMTVSVNIITESKPDVLLVPLNAVKISGESSYVEVLVDGQVQRKTVTVGSSNDTMIEIVAGLAEGEEIISQTISNGTTSSSSSSQNRAAGFGGGEFRMLR